MRKLTMMTMIAASALLGTTAVAQTTGGAGASTSGRGGSTAGGATAGTTQDHGTHSRKMKRGDRQARRGGAAGPTGNSASTYGSGTINTTRDSATGGVTTGGTATGSDPQASSTAIDAYGSTTQHGGAAEVYGDTTAKSTPRPRS